MQCTVNGLRVQYIDEGSGPVVLLVHGWGAPAETYRLLINHLRQRHRVIAPDLPGFGGSQEPPEPWTVDRFTDFVDAFVRTLGIEQCVPIGHSNGGRILIKWLTRPERAARVPKMILMDAAGLPPHRGLDYYCKVYTFKAAKFFFGLPGIRRLFPHAVDKARKRFGSADYRAASPVMQRSMSLAVNEDLTALLPQIAVPTLLIWGEKDTATPLSDGQKMEKRIPDAGLVVLKNAGHFAFAEDFGTCARVLDSFLN